MLTVSLRLYILSHCMRRSLNYLASINLLYHVKLVLPTNMVFHYCCILFLTNSTMNGKSTSS